MGNGVWGNFYQQKWGVNHSGQWWHRGRLRLFRCVWKWWTLRINGHDERWDWAVSYFQANPESWSMLKVWNPSYPSSGTFSDQRWHRHQRRVLNMFKPPPMASIRSSSQRRNCIPVCPAHGALEQGVPRTDHLVLLKEVGQGARGVSRAMKAFHRQIRAPLHHIPICQEVIWRRQSFHRWWNPKVSALLIHLQSFVGSSLGF